MRGNIITGASYFFQGIKQIFTPDFRRFVWVPLIINIILLATILTSIALVLNNYFKTMISDYPQWVILILGGIFWLLFSVMSFLIGIFLFTMLANLIASPFYGLLSEAVLEKFEGFTAPPLTFKSVFVVAYHSIARELRKLLYFIPWIIVCLLFLIFPITWPFFPFIWWIVMAWIMSIQYSDYAADNQKIPFKQMLASIKQAPLTALGFGGVVSFALAIPVVNLFVPAAAVVGGTLLWQKTPKS